MLLPITSGAFLFNTAGSTPQMIGPVATTTIPIVEKTYDSEVTRLAIKYGQNESLARKIISCESSLYGSAENKNYRPEFDPKTDITTMVHWSSDWGYFQVNDYWHEQTAKKMGLDIFNWEDNLEYGFYLLSTDGTRHWAASRHCWYNKQ